MTHSWLSWRVTSIPHSCDLERCSKLHAMTVLANPRVRDHAPVARMLVNGQRKNLLDFVIGLWFELLSLRQTRQSRGLCFRYASNKKDENRQGAAARAS